MVQVVMEGEIKYHADYQCNWAGVIKPMRRGRYVIERADHLTIPGDAPKYFVRVKEYVPGRRSLHRKNWTAYIAKLGSKWYPIESITEHLLTRLGQVFGVKIAESDLRIVEGQVRFLSKYFLSRTERLVHGIDIFREHLDREMVEAIAIAKQEREFYTFQTVCTAMKDVFPDDHERLMAGLVEMLGFDALSGNNDRHPANWGVIVPVAIARVPVFAPVFDTARGLFWNNDETKVRSMLADEHRLRSYANKSKPLIGWDGSENLDHFELIGRIHEGYPQYRLSLLKFVDKQVLENALAVLKAEFDRLLSNDRLRLIRQCLTLRQELYRKALGQ